MLIDKSFKLRVAGYVDSRRLAGIAKYFREQGISIRSQSELVREAVKLLEQILVSENHVRRVITPLETRSELLSITQIRASMDDNWQIEDEF